MDSTNGNDTSNDGNNLIIDHCKKKKKAGDDDYDWEYGLQDNDDGSDNGSDDQSNISIGGTPVRTRGDGFDPNNRFANATEDEDDESGSGSDQDSNRGSDEPPYGNGPHRSGFRRVRRVRVPLDRRGRNGRQPSQRDLPEADLPHAYPINEEPRPVIPVVPENDIMLSYHDINGREEEQQEENNQETGKNALCLRKTRKILLITTFIGAILALNGVLIDSIIPRRKQKSENDTTDQKSESNDNNVVSSDKLPYITQNDVLNETSHPSQTTSTTPPPLPSPQTNTGGKVYWKPLCHRDPMALQLIDLDHYDTNYTAPVIYTFCPNVDIYPYELDKLMVYNNDDGGSIKYDFSTGSHFPLLIFRPNITLRCGYTGSLENNCTFHGGWSQIRIQNNIDLLNKPLERASAENTVISGFKFTGGTSGSSIVVGNITGDLTLRNCHFYNNTGNFASVALLGPESNFDLHVENSIFESNTYVHKEQEGGEMDKRYFKNDDGQYDEERNKRIGAILSTNTKPSKIHVNQSKFINNNFVPKNNETLAQKTKHTDKNPTIMSTSASAVINIWWPSPSQNLTLGEQQHGDVEVSNSCFVGNREYSSSASVSGRTEWNKKSILTDEQAKDGNYKANSTNNNEDDDETCLVAFQKCDLMASSSTSLSKSSCGEEMNYCFPCNHSGIP